MSSSKDEFNHLMAQIFSIWFEVQDDLPEWNYQDWVTWADDQVLKWDSSPPGWLCEISCAQSQQDVVNALENGVHDWSRTVSQELVALSCEPLHIGWLYCRLRRDEISLKKFLDEAWYYVEHGGGEEERLAFSSELGKLEREWMRRKSAGLANDQEFLEQLAIRVSPLGDKVYQRLQKLPIQL